MSKERTFVVIVPRENKPSMGYPDLTGYKALQCMRTLNQRCVCTIARTTANGITEDLTLDDMEMIYDFD